MENTVDTPPTTPPALLVTRSVHGCLSAALNTPVPKMLFSEFWSEGELSVLFGGGVKVVIIDSLATLKFFVNEVFLLSHLVRLKDSLNLSVLLLAGPKKAQPGRSLSLGNLAANKMLCGIAGSIFAMGVGQEERDRRYLVHLKGDEHEKVYHRDNVIVGRNMSTSVTGGLPGFEFIGRETEEEQLAQPLPPEGTETKILEYRRKAPYASLGEIAKWTGTNKMKVKRVLERYEATDENLNATPGKLSAGTGASKTSMPASSFSNTGLQPGGPESSHIPGSGVKLPGVPSQPIKTPVNTAVTPVTPNSKPGAFYPLPQHPNEPGEEETLEQSLKTLDAMITSYCKPQPKTESQKPLTYTQQLKKRLAEARKGGKK